MSFRSWTFISCLALGLSATLVACDDGESSDSASQSGTGGGSSGTGGGTSATGGEAGGTSTASGTGVCAFDGEKALPEPVDGVREVSAKHPYLWYGGRVDCDAADGPGFAFPGVTVRVRFEGTALELKLRDHGTGTATTTNYYDVSVDGGEPTLLEASSETEVYPLATDLPAGEHEVVIWKRTETNVGSGEILGFRLTGDKLLPAQGHERRLEFIGDSITCGYGNEIETDMPDMFHFTSRNENSHNAYGAVTAQLLDAEYMAVSYSGKGMSRNYGGGAGKTVPEMYLDINADLSNGPVWDITRYTPDAVIINLGTNDFSTVGVDRDLYKSKYIEFLTTLRGYYPNAALVTAIGPMLSDYYPVGEMVWTKVQADIAEVVDARHAAGDDNVHTVIFQPQTSPYGEDWHPTKATHAAMAEQMSTKLKEVLGW